ncbi:MAG: GIY-YIG nuclease family protein [Bacteroidota bacterium]
MSKLGTIDIAGKDGHVYSFKVYEWGTKFNQVPGVYMVSRRSANGRTYSHEFIYVGETEDMSGRFSHHHRQKCFDAKRKNAICFHRCANADERLAIERNIRLKQDPPCNREAT